MTARTNTRYDLTCRPRRLFDALVAAPSDGLPGRGLGTTNGETYAVNNIIYLVGLVVVVLAILGFLGLR
jgi:hypothetical protein